MELNKIIQGDSLQVLKTLQDESIDCVVTSPPYWNLRDYGVIGQLGLEPTFQEYIQKLCDIFDEVKRVLKNEGTCWINLGDTYSGNKEGKTDKKISDYLKDTSIGIHKKATYLLGLQ
jgi:DNA modification methylase